MELRLSAWFRSSSQLTCWASNLTEDLDLSALSRCVSPDHRNRTRLTPWRTPRRALV